MMNDYFDYFNYINNLNSYSNAGLVSNNSNSNSINNVNNNDPYNGFIRGNMFDGIYNQYMNYKPQELNPANEKEYAKMLLQMYCFAAHDLGLYLDVNPNDTAAINERANYINMYNQALAQFENNYGPITQDSRLLNNTPWAWDTKKWPWEGMR